jgi:alanine racemase
MSLSWIEVSRSALLANVKAYKKLAAGSKLMAVVKSNAYGHGADLVAETIQDQVDWFGVVSGQEAIALRDKEISKPILVLSYWDEDAAEELLRRNVSLVLHSKSQLPVLDKAAKKLKTKAKIHLKIDTGTSRLGFFADQVLDLIREIKTHPAVELEGIFSHFAASEDKAEYTKKQLKVFADLLDLLDRQGIRIPLKHIACSASAEFYPASRFDMVRVGIGLYGLKSYTGKSRPAEPVRLTPALTWKTKVISLKHAPKGTFVGYGCTYRTKTDEALAVLPVGYFDGYDRKLSNTGTILIKGVRCPVRGRVFMNMIIVGVNQVPNVKIGDEAVLIGQSGRERVTADDLARKIGTINYEVVTRLGPLTPRIQIP